MSHVVTLRDILRLVPTTTVTASYVLSSPALAVLHRQEAFNTELEVLHQPLLSHNLSPSSLTTELCELEMFHDHASPLRRRTHAYLTCLVRQSTSRGFIPVACF